MATNARRVLPFPEMPKPMPRVTLWDGHGHPDEKRLRALLAEEGYQVVGWSQESTLCLNESAQGYPPHVHVYPELLWLIEGSVTIILPAERRLLELLPGDRIEIPNGLVHGTMAGPDGATYLLATR